MFSKPIPEELPHDDYNNDNNKSGLEEALDGIIADIRVCKKKKKKQWKWVKERKAPEPPEPPEQVQVPVPVAADGDYQSLMKTAEKSGALDALRSIRYDTPVAGHMAQLPDLMEFIRTLRPEEWRWVAPRPDFFGDPRSQVNVVDFMERAQAMSKYDSVTEMLDKAKESVMQNEKANFGGAVKNKMSSKQKRKYRKKIRKQERALEGLAERLDKTCAVFPYEIVWGFVVFIDITKRLYRAEARLWVNNMMDNSWLDITPPVVGTTQAPGGTQLLVKSRKLYSQEQRYRIVSEPAIYKMGAIFNRDPLPSSIKELASMSGFNVTVADQHFGIKAEDLGVIDIRDEAGKRYRDNTGVDYQNDYRILRY